jgi:hypothetical protein
MGGRAACNRNEGGKNRVSRALRHQGLWLTLAYVGLILLMARVYA